MLASSFQTDATVSFTNSHSDLTLGLDAGYNWLNDETCAIIEQLQHQLTSQWEQVSIRLCPKILSWTLIQS